ncbi:MAG: DUF3307 domain-containing protein [Bacillota bacterium]|nr:DUF3307 domain-containing protein [Bacillota bacterium]
MTLLWMGVLAQVLADFVLQTDRLVKMKSAIKWRAFLEHGLALFLCTFVLTHLYGIKLALSFSTAAASVHLLIDYLKSLVTKRIRRKSSHIIAFVLDQLIHLYALFLLSFLFTSGFTVKPDETVLALYLTCFPGINLSDLFNRYWDKTVIVSIIFVYVLFGGAVLNRLFLNCMSDLSKDNASPNIGKWIGILERAIILVLIASDNVTAVAMVLTAKSIARFRQLNQRDFAEYYLVGTLISTVLAFIGGLAFRASC